MSDRIDELVGYIRADLVDRGGAVALTELATIAREKVHCGGVIESTSGECLTLMEVQNAAFDAEARAAEWIDRCYQSDERAWACESVGIPGLYARVEAAQAEADKWRKVAEEMRDLWNHMGCAGCGNWPQAECAAQYKRFVDALYRAVCRHNTAVEQEEAE